jgi:hypothetical protein
VAGAAVVLGVALAEGADGVDGADDGTGPGAAVQDARAAAAVAAAKTGRDL